MYFFFNCPLRTLKYYGAAKNCAKEETMNAIESRHAGHCVIGVSSHHRIRGEHILLCSDRQPVTMDPLGSISIDCLLHKIIARHATETTLIGRNPRDVIIKAASTNDMTNKTIMTGHFYFFHSSSSWHHLFIMRRRRRRRPLSSFRECKSAPQSSIETPVGRTNVI